MFLSLLSCHSLFVCFMQVFIEYHCHYSTLPYYLRKPSIVILGPLPEHMSANCAWYLHWPTMSVVKIWANSLPCLQKCTVEELIPLVTGKIKEPLLTNCHSFPSAHKDMTVIRNQQLSNHLSTIANLFVSSIVIANITVELQASQAFDFAV
ncbi:hypothetical protein BY458DRAFT_495201 [Sporodiniella umbellata]|nr:hypothetical protein BY458DRAFT_495201 [Sporodiniella umbellata]